MEMQEKPTGRFRYDMERDGLHRYLSSTMPRGSIYLTEGKHGSGKSVLMQRLCYGFLKHGHSVSYVSTESSSRDFVEQMDSLDYPATDFMLKRQLQFFPLFPVVGTAIPRKDFLTRLHNSGEIFENEIVIIDCFSSLVGEEMDVTGAYETMALFKRITSSGRSILITVDPEELDAEVLRPFRAASNVYLQLEITIEEGAMRHLIYVRRFTNAEGRVGNIIGFRVEPGAGLIVDITAVA